MFDALGKRGGGEGIWGVRGILKAGGGDRDSRQGRIGAGGGVREGEGEENFLMRLYIFISASTKNYSSYDIKSFIFTLFSNIL